MKNAFMLGTLLFSFTALSAELHLANTYRINPSVANFDFVKLTVLIDEGEIHTFVDFTGREISGNTGHFQGIYKANRCPRLESDDHNKDGIIDINEAKSVLGEVYIPLDSSIATVARGSNMYPLSDSAGQYIYRKKASYKEFLEDLKVDSDFSFRSGLVFMVQGVKESIELPSTVGSNDRFFPRQTLPVACGKILQYDNSEAYADEWYQTWY